MLREIKLIYIFIPTVIAYAIGALIWFFRSRQLSSVQKIRHLLILNLGAMLVVSFLCYSALPGYAARHPYVLYTEDLQSSEVMLKYLQQSNDALARTADVLDWFLFFFGLLFMPTTFIFTLAFPKGDEKKDN